VGKKNETASGDGGRFLGNSAHVRKPLLTPAVLQYDESRVQRVRILIESGIPFEVYALGFLGFLMFNTYSG
jgi:hypothetical protein